MSSVNRAIIETIVRKAIKEVQDSPERASRNLVDLALNFVDGQFQQRFLEATQRLLKKENSAYFRLVRDVVTHVNPDKITEFSLNVGYNSCTVGARKIRQIEKEQHFNIPWSMFLEIDGAIFRNNEEKYEEILKQCESLGIYTYALAVIGKIDGVLQWIAKHKNDAFVLCCLSEEITESIIDEGRPINNLMFAVSYDDNVDTACNLLRENEFLYSVYLTYTEDDISEAENGNLFACTESLHPIFTILQAQEGSSLSVRKKLHECVVKVREEQKHATIPWAAFFDNCAIATAISMEPCIAGFDRDGSLFTYNGKHTQETYNLFKHEVKDILKAAFPKKSGGN